jgi:hypothetical protein
LDGEVEMSISEFNEPAVFNPGSQHPVKTRRPEKYGSTYRLELNNTLYEGVRYAWIHVKELRGTAMLKNIRLICQVKPVNYQGSFACSDNMLTRIWYTGAYTVKLNLLHDYLGAILMERSDRHSWTGDAHTSQAAALVAFGNRDFVKMNIRHTSRQSNGIASYALYWTLSVADYFNYSRDADLVEEMRDNLCGKLDEAYRHFDNLPGLSFYGWDERLGAGFENPDCRESQNAYRMLCIWAWRECAEMLRHVGHEDLADKYRKYAAEKVDRLRASGPGWTSEFGVHAAADAIKAGFADEREAGELWKNAFSDRQNRLSYSPFNQYFIIQAMAVMKRYDEALTTIDDLWGGQIRYGGTTFFEDYRPSWNIISGYNDAPVNNQCGYTSFCHPWSAGVTKWISEEVLGIKPVEPGFRKFVFKPNLGNRLTWVKGTVPTPYGAIEAFYDKRTGEYSLVVPPGIEGEFVKPDDAGEYREEPFVYALKSDFREDNVTGGSWVGKYGSQGYILCNYDDAGHVVKLPGFITNADVNKEEKPLFKNGVSVHWASATQDRRALVSPGKRKERSLGAYTTRDANGWCQTMTVDLPSAKPYTLSIYFVDWERDGRRSAIEVFDLESMKLIAPVYMVRDYKEGKYVTFKVDRPVRIRVDQVRGKGAAVCGLFFDI